MTHTHGKDHILTENARKLIRVKARQLCRRRDFSESDIDDVQQELWLAVCKKIECFDPARSSLDVFIDLVVNQKIASLLCSRQRVKRDQSSVLQSLDEPLNTPGDEQTSLVDSISEADLGRRLGREHVDPTHLWEQCESIQSAMAVMPPLQRAFCQRLMEETLTEASRSLQISRRNAQTLRLQIRTLLENFGVKKS